MDEPVPRPSLDKAPPCFIEEPNYAGPSPLICRLLLNYRCRHLFAPDDLGRLKI
jgi:hypothetical protein